MTDWSNPNQFRISIKYTYRYGKLQLITYNLSISMFLLKLSYAFNAADQQSTTNLLQTHHKPTKFTQLR